MHVYISNINPAKLAFNRHDCEQAVELVAADGRRFVPLSDGLFRCTVCTPPKYTYDDVLGTPVVVEHTRTTSQVTQQLPVEYACVQTTTYALDEGHTLVLYGTACDHWFIDVNPSIKTFQSIKPYIARLLKSTKCADNNV